MVLNKNKNMLKSCIFSQKKKKIQNFRNFIIFKGKKKKNNFY
jgi:hypothetical protein